jgi:hypothetical protein
LWGTYKANYECSAVFQSRRSRSASDHTITTALIEACEDGVGMGTAVSGGMFLATEVVAMPASPEERAARYRNYAAFLRQLAAEHAPIRPARNCAASPTSSTGLP